MTPKFLSRSQMYGSAIQQESEHVEEAHWREKGETSSNFVHEMSQGSETVISGPEQGGSSQSKGPLEWVRLSRDTLCRPGGKEAKRTTLSQRERLRQWRQQRRPGKSSWGGWSEPRGNGILVAHKRERFKKI